MYSAAPYSVYHLKTSQMCPGIMWKQKIEAHKDAFQRPKYDSDGVIMAKYKSKNSGCCSVTFNKWFLIIYNLILLILGGLTVGVAIWTLYDRHQYVALLTSITYPTIVYLLLVAGILLIIVSILGFFAAAKENRISLIIYIILLLLILATEATVGILSFIYWEQVHLVLEMNLNDNFMTRYGIDTSITESVDDLQKEFKCCGVMKFEEWNSTSLWVQDGMANHNLVPDSCCISVTPECGQRTHPSNIYYVGCMEKMEAHIKDHLYYLCAVALGICAIPIFGVVCAFILYYKLRRVFEITKPRPKNTEMQALFS
ncbi:CD151 antigen-like isoform X2 [Atheta coriaria]|uniref:CD151 antigen-like isoform X2 n=1 Tax=Dalotia coriaria TaxID=877792 RepID=UPI0031F4609E